MLAADPPTGAIGISVNGGDDFTKSAAVKVKLIWPSCGERVVLSNDGGFGGTKAVKLAAQVSWKLKSSGSERLPKTVYARYLEVGEDESALASGSLSTFTDDIILDTTAPTIKSATLARAGSASVAALKSYKLRVRAADQTSGVSAIQLAVDRRRPLTSVKYSASKTVRLAARPVWVRVADGAGNQSPWKRLR